MTVCANAMEPKVLELGSFSSLRTDAGLYESHMLMIFLTDDLRKSGRKVVITIFVPLTLTSNTWVRSVLASIVS